MDQDHGSSGLPPAKGSPFRTKNFSKFFFGIIIAALVLLAVWLLLFQSRARHAEPAGHSSLTPARLGQTAGKEAA